MSLLPTVSIIGTVGVPAQYGGFETLAEALVRAAARRGVSDCVTVYCSAPQAARPLRRSYEGARLRYLPLRANGAQSMVYDALSLALSVARRQDHILVLGVSGAFALPLVRLISRANLIVHVDGIEWQRAKWTGVARWILKRSERLAARWAHVVISDNAAITHHLRARYAIDPVEIDYGGDQALAVPPGDIADLGLPASYSLALARIEPENNMAMILEAFADAPDRPLVVIGDWSVSAAAQDLRRRYENTPHLHLLDPIFDPARLRAVREGAGIYVHGHSAGGTNPSLVEMMHIGRPIAAFDCPFNRATTEDKAAYFQDAAGLAALLQRLSGSGGEAQGDGLRDIARRRYTWDGVAAKYFDLFGL